MIRLLAASESMQWIVYAVGALTIVYVVMRPSFKKKDPLNPSTPKLGLAQQRAVERQMQNLLVELSDMARQITGQLDTRAAKLETLIKDADDRLAALRRASAGAPASTSDQRAPDFRVGAQQSFTFASPSQAMASSEN